MSSFDWPTALSEESEKYDFLFSVVIPVYNTEEYLEEVIESVVNQTIGFEDNIQLILVNNATQDNSEEICLKYKEKYPDNVVYVKLEEYRGPGGALNRGMQNVGGKYVNFLNGKEKWEIDAFSKVAEFIVENADSVDIACVNCNIILRNEKSVFSTQKDSMVANVFTTPNCVILSHVSCFFLKAAISDFVFEENKETNYDVRFIHSIIFSKYTYGMCATAYLLMIVDDKKYIVDGCEDSLSFYMEELEDNLKSILQISFEMFDIVIPYAQNYILNEIIKRLKKKYIGQLSEESNSKIRCLLNDYLKYIPDAVIIENRAIFKEEKLFLLSVKWDANAKKYINTNGKNFYYQRYKLFSVSGMRDIKVMNLEVKDGELRIDGRMDLPLDDWQEKIHIIDNWGKIYPFSLYALDASASKSFLQFTYKETYGFKVKVPLADGLKLYFCLYHHSYKLILPLGFALVSKLSNKLNNTYCVLDKYIIKYKDRALQIYKSDAISEMKSEGCVLAELLGKFDIRTALWRVIIKNANRLKKILNKKIWLFMDRFAAAGDNAEYVYNYVVKKCKNNCIIPVFCVAKDSPDYKRLKKIGKVIPYDTKLYRIVFAICDLLISSQSFYSTGNTFYKRTEYLKDLFQHKWVYLQHGVIKDNHADTQSKHKKALDLFVSTANPEYESLLTDYYGYDESVVKLTGLARYDAIYNVAMNRNCNEKKIILLAPTWRKFLGSEWNEKKQSYCYNPKFRDSKFFDFYNSLLTDKRIVSLLQEKQVHMELQLHPRIWEQNVDFTETNVSGVQREKKGLIEEVCSTCLLITDYSSIAFDYVYADIPVIYAQFDQKEFYANHAYTRGYFDYETMGFGPVCYDYESTVQAIIQAVENNCVMEDKYQKRVDEFFAYRDNHNCERIYQEILKLDGEE